MKNSRYTPEQVAFGLHQAEEGTPVAEVCRKQGISEATYYRWKSKYGGLEVSEAKRLRALEEENRRLKKLVADLSLDKQMLQDVLRKSPEACSTAAPVWLPEGSLPRQRTPGLRGADPAPGQLTVPDWADEQEALRMRLKDLAKARVSYANRRRHLLPEFATVLKVVRALGLRLKVRTGPNHSCSVGRHSTGA